MRDELLQKAFSTLFANRAEGYTKPSPKLYPHQWNWDSAFISLGWMHVEWDRAAEEIESLLRGQWEDGMIPQIRYDRQSLSWYFPGPELWPNTRPRSPGELTSGISQPPVLPTAAYRVGLAQRTTEKRLSWWRKVYPALRDYVLYFPRNRTVGTCPLIAVVHPWESGLDNSPRWDFAVSLGFRPQGSYARIDNKVIPPDQRPLDRDYDLYIYLVEVIAGHGYNLEEYWEITPFLVYDVLFNAIWYRAARDVNRIAEALGEPPVVSPGSLEEFAASFRELLWNPAEGIYMDYNVKAGSQISLVTAAGLVPIYAGLVDAASARAMLDRYIARCPRCHLIPGVPPDQPGFEPGRYCRGPVWIHLNWMLIQGLEELGCLEESRRLREATLSLVATNGMYECFHAFTGQGCGSDQFSWTAALTIDLLMTSPARDRA